MQTLQFYRYIVICRPGPSTRTVLAQAGAVTGQRLRGDEYHLTFCVISEVPQRDHSIAERVSTAFAGGGLHSAPILLGRVTGGPLGALIRAIGKQDELQDLYVTVVRRLKAQGFEPKYRNSGFSPHFTLGYDPCNFVPFDVAHEWIPGELLLIESEVGLTRHNVLGAWPLLAPRQLRLPFDETAPPCGGDDLIAAAGPARRSAA